MIEKSAAFAFLLVAGAGAHAQQQADGRTTEFLTQAVEGNVAEIQLATLAGKRAESADVREFADTIVADHKVALDESTTIARHMGVTVGGAPSAEAQSHYERLSRESGAEFDRQFVELMLRNHEATIEDYRSYVEQAEGESDAVEYAETTLPTLETHLEAARSLEDQGASG